MKQDIERVLAEFEEAIQGVKDAEGLEALRVAFLGRKGALAELMKGLSSLDIEEKKEAGKLMNEAKKAIERRFSHIEEEVAKVEEARKRDEEWIDITLPPATPEKGHAHLTTQSIKDIVSIFKHLGFVRVRHPEIDWDYYTFEALNMPKDHAARDEWETFFIDNGKGEVTQGEKGKVVLVPHTSNGQVREMEKGRLPIRMININKTYRRQAGVRHLPMFHQFEGLVVDKGITITHLKGVLEYFVREFFGEGREVRFRPYHFRFTEPSFEIDITCGICKGTGKLDAVTCKLCKGGWLELGGAGMVHPNVLKAGGIDPEEYSGFAFGWGIERTMMMRSGVNIDDIRVLYKNDLRFLRQF